MFFQRRSHEVRCRMPQSTACDSGFSFSYVVRSRHSIWLCSHSRASWTKFIGVRIAPNLAYLSISKRRRAISCAPYHDRTAGGIHAGASEGFFLPFGRQREKGKGISFFLAVAMLCLLGLCVQGAKYHRPPDWTGAK